MNTSIKTFAVEAPAVIAGWPCNFYLVEKLTCKVIKTFGTHEELAVYADLNRYEVEETKSYA